jgi:hypothetical protein
MAIVACVLCSFNLTSQIYLAKPISLMFELLIFQDPSVSPLAPSAVSSGPNGKGGRRGVYDKVG